MVKAIPMGSNLQTCAPCSILRWVALTGASQLGRSELERVTKLEPSGSHICTLGLQRSVSEEPLFHPVMKNGAIKEGCISGNVVNDVLKRRMTDAGYDATGYGAHSLRAGFVTEALMAGASHHQVMRQTGHKSPGMVEKYARERTPLENNAVVLLGL